MEAEIANAVDGTFPPNLFSQEHEQEMLNAWPGKDVISIVKKYREALAKFHREFPAKDSIPSDKIGTSYAAIQVFLERSAFNDKLLQLWGETADGNGYRAFIEDLNWHKFYMLVSREAGGWEIQAPDGRATWEDVRPWEWFNTTGGQEADFLDGVWDGFSQRWHDNKGWK